jgi:VWFA-related protein
VRKLWNYRFAVPLALGFWATGASGGPQDAAVRQDAATSPTSQSNLPVIRENVRQVLVPVVVTDRQGHYVTGLKATDFQVLEDGSPQKIVGFGATNEPSASSAVSASKPVPQTVPANAPAVVPSARAANPRRTYLICVDVLHTAFSNFARVRTALSRFFEHEQNTDSQYSLIALGREPKIIQDSTRDPAAVLAAIQSKNFLNVIQDSEARGLARDAQQFTDLMRYDYCMHCACESKGPAPDGPGCPGAKGRLLSFLLISSERTSALNQNFLRGLSELVKATASMPTQRTILFISDGFNRNPGRELYAIMDGFAPKDRSFQFNSRDTEDQLQSVLKLAVHYDLKFYTIDSRGLYGAASLDGNPFDASSGGPTPERLDLNVMSAAHENTDALFELAHETGGLFFENNNDLFKGIYRAFADGRESYLLAYVPANNTMDGKYRKIQVEVKGKKLVINAKAGYWATTE